MGTRASDVVAHVGATSSFGLTFRIEVVGGNRVEIAVSSLRNLCFGKEEKVRFRGGEMMFHRMKIRAKTANVAEIEKKEVRGVIKTPLGSAARRGVLPGGICGPPPVGDSEAWCMCAILKF